MKLATTPTLIFALSASSLAIAQSGGMMNMETKDMNMTQCMEMKGMKGMDMKDMDMQKCQGMMNNNGMKGMEMGKNAQGMTPKAMVHKATAVVKAADPSKGLVTLAHGPVKSLNWPAMTMGFSVKDKMLFDKLAIDKKVEIEFMQQGSDYIVTVVK